MFRLNPAQILRRWRGRVSRRMEAMSPEGTWPDGFFAQSVIFQGDLTLDVVAARRWNP